MCRLFVCKSKKPVNVQVYLNSAKNSLKHQAEKNRNGWGISFYDSKHCPHVLKEPNPAFTDNTFDEVGSLVQSDLVFSHIRKGKHTDINNCHPFIYKNYSFMHNGLIDQFKKIKPYLIKLINKKYLKMIKGDTDTEHVFALILSKIEKIKYKNTKNIAGAMKEALHDIQNLYLAHTPNCVRPSLNLVFSDGENVFITRYNRSLYLLDDLENLIRKKLKSKRTDHIIKKISNLSHLKAIVIASEKLDNDKMWKEIPNDHLLIINKSFNVSLERLRLSDKI